MIAPLHTEGPVAVTQDGTRLFTCVGDEALMTDLKEGKEICRFAGVRGDFSLNGRCESDREL